MRYVKPTLIVGWVTVLLLSASLAWSQPADKLTYLKFSGPVELPGLTLPAGTYTFKLADSMSNRHIVQVFDRDGTKLYTTLLAIPAERLEPTGETVVTFAETPADTPPAVKYWYYPGDLIGQEFVYPKDQAMRIARASRESVLATDTTSSDIEEMKTAAVTRVGPEGESAARAETPGEREPMATEPWAEQAEPGVAGTSGRLPETASELPLVGLVGLLSFGGALLVRRLRRSVA